MQARTREGRSYRLLTILDEYSRECQAIVVGRRLTHNDVIEHLATLFVQRGVPVYLRSDNDSRWRYFVSTLEFSGKYRSLGWSLSSARSSAPRRPRW